MFKYWITFERFPLAIDYGGWKRKRQNQLNAEPAFRWCVYVALLITAVSYSF